MPTVKDFEDQKTELLGLLWSISAYVPDDTVEEIGERIEKLQPPRPTCSTCDYVNLECDSNTYGGFLCKNINALNADGKVASTSGGYNIRIKGIKNFGCNQHSDYGVKDE